MQDNPKPLTSSVPRCSIRAQWLTLCILTNAILAAGPATVCTSKHVCARMLCSLINSLSHKSLHASVDLPPYHNMKATHIMYWHIHTHVHTVSWLSVLYIHIYVHIHLHIFLLVTRNNNSPHKAAPQIRSQLYTYIHSSIPTYTSHYTYGTQCVYNITCMHIASHTTWVVCRRYVL